MTEERPAQWQLDGAALVAMIPTRRSSAPPDQQPIEPRSRRAPQIKPTYLQLLYRTMRETGCTKWQAHYFLWALRKRAGRGKTRLGPIEMWLVHPILDRVMPDYQIAKPGSLHEALDRGLLPAGKTFQHGKMQKEHFDCSLTPIDFIKVRHQ